ncbi:unnamed protein product [Periconia digitata]|uniref:Uncharacterized protein n=1 Tax=Periconia digitata TaxID=1303443 RepID=A0A9W4UIZ9_9PLEO|nr:unnamed protein product [Periconia digitata]
MKRERDDLKQFSHVPSSQSRIRLLYTLLTFDHHTTEVVIHGNDTNTFFSFFISVSTISMILISISFPFFIGSCCPLPPSCHQIPKPTNPFCQTFIDYGTSFLFSLFNTFFLLLRLHIHQFNVLTLVPLHRCTLPSYAPIDAYRVLVHPSRPSSAVPEEQGRKSRALPFQPPLPLLTCLIRCSSRFRQLYSILFFSLFTTTYPRPPSFTAQKAIDRARVIFFFILPNVDHRSPPNHSVDLTILIHSLFVHYSKVLHVFRLLFAYQAARDPQSHGAKPIVPRRLGTWRRIVPRSSPPLHKKNMLRW